LCPDVSPREHINTAVQKFGVGKNILVFLSAHCDQKFSKNWGIFLQFKIAVFYACLFPPQNKKYVIMSFYLRVA